MTQWFPPERGTFVAAAIADGLASRGHQVDVLTGFPNYPTGHLYDGYQLRPYRRESRSESVTVHRAPLYSSHDSSSIKRMANYLSYGLAASWTARRKLDAPDVWLTYSSPATACLPALLAPKRLRAPSFLILQDLWPDSVIESGFINGRIGQTAESLLTRFCDLSYRRSTGIGVISPGMREILIQRGVATDRIHDTPNWVEDDISTLSQCPVADLRRSLELPNGRLFMYAGNIGELQGLEPLVSAFDRCPEVQLVFVGEGVARRALRAQVRAAGSRNIHFVDSQPKKLIGQFIAASDVQIVSLRDTTLLRATMPSKVQTSMAASKPILAHAAGDVADLVRTSSCGIAVTPGAIDQTVEAIRALSSLSQDQLGEMGRNARACYDANFTPEAGVDRLEAMLAMRHTANRSS